jgi:integrase
MIIVDALTGIRRSELMGLQWCDVDFIGSRIEIRRSMVDQIVGKCKTETSRKPVVIDEHIAQALIAWRQESIYTGPQDWVLGFTASQRETALVAFSNHAVLHSACRKTGWYSEEHRLAHVSTHIFDSHQVVGCGRKNCAGTPATRIVQDDDGWVHAGPRTAETPSARTLAELIMRTGTVGHA